jgi:hypothetical protein
VKNGDTTKGIFRSELKWVFAIIAMLGTVVYPYFSIKQDVALIQKDIAVINSNHLGTTQRLAEQMATMQINLVENQKAVIELQKQTLVILQRIQ